MSVTNVPDDWHQYWLTCPDCGQRYHASEGECDCDDLRTQAAEARIWVSVDRIAPWLARAIDVGSGCIVTLPAPLSRLCGYHDEEQRQLHKENRKTLVGLLQKVADDSGESIELRVTGRDGSVWTDEVIEP